MKIINEGLDKIDVSSLSDDMKLNLLTQAGDALLKKKRLEEAAGAYDIADNKQKLRETAHWFEEQKRFADAAIFMRHVGTYDELIALAERCIAAGAIAAAKQLYKQAGDDHMVIFLEKNF